MHRASRERINANCRDIVQIRMAANGF
jgi:hypothetical protein